VEYDIIVVGGLREDRKEHSLLNGYGITTFDEHPPNLLVATYTRHVLSDS